uniref:Uncharacterized protein n=1 Tax=Oryza meridionalis TaxID=40149 RepID=A0A0E0DS89_9ORYZ
MALARVGLTAEWRLEAGGDDGNRELPVLSRRCRRDRADRGHHSHRFIKSNSPHLKSTQVAAAGDEDEMEPQQGGLKARGGEVTRPRALHYRPPLPSSPHLGDHQGGSSSSRGSSLFPSSPSPSLSAEQMRKQGDGGRRRRLPGFFLH